MSTESEIIRKRRRRSSNLPIQRVALTVDEFVDTTRISKATVYRLMVVGKLKFAQIGGTRRIPISELQRLGLT